MRYVRSDGGDKRIRVGLVRGAIQREVKLEITGNQKDELIKYLDDILSGLRYQEGQYDLVKIHDKEYQDKLRIQSEYWEKLKTEIGEVRSKGYQNTDIVNMSEIYFEMADETVFAAENYSEYRKKILLEDMAEMSLWQLFITQAKQKLRNC